MSPNPSNEQRQAFERLFSSNYQTFFNIGFNICRNRDFSKDIVQSFFVELWETEIWKKDITDLKAYLFRSFYRKAIRDCKDEKKRKEFSLNPELNIPIPSFEELWIEVEEQAAMQDKISKVLESLPDKQRQALDLRFQEGLKYEEIAHQTGKSRQTIYNQIHEGVKKIREFISANSSS